MTWKMAELEHTNEAFSLCLLYYDNYRSAKLLNPNFYRDVLKAYREKPAVMLKKLKQKYSYEIPESVSINHLRRLISIYSVPQEYVDVMRMGIRAEKGEEALAAFDTADKYDATLDVNSTDFDADKAFLAHRDPLYVTNPAGPTKQYDNLGKVKHLVFPDHKEFVAPDRSFIDSVKASQKAESKKLQEKKSTVFEDVIQAVLRGESGKRKKTANYGSTSSDAAGESGGVVEISSPFHLVNDLMQKKARAQVIIRHKSGLRGVLHGYIQAADRHMNLLLIDVDEVSASFGKKVTLKALRCKLGGKDRNGTNSTPMIQRHLDQVLLRGDNIVLVAKV